MEGTVAGVRIVPPVVEFLDAETDVVHQMTLTVQNLSKSSKVIRFHGPASKCFRLKVKNPDHAIAPGLEVSALVEYYTTRAEDAQDRVILVADNDVVEIPLMAYTPSPQLELSGPADFGVTVADSKVLRQEIFVLNEGSLPGEFKIRYTGNEPITIMPSGGIVRPGAKQGVKIEFNSKTPGKLNEVAQVKLEGQPTTTLQIIGNVVERSLELLTIDTEEPVQTINFGSTYYGTDLTQSFLIYNNGPAIAHFVVILEEGGEGQEVGVDLTKNATAMMLSQTDSQDLGTANDLTTLVTALPSQGSLYPHEKMEIHFRFSPRYTKSNKGWKTSDQPPPRKDYTLFMHIETVGSVAGISNNSSGGINNGGSRVEVALQGTALPVLLSISPSPVFKFGDCPVGEQIDALCTVNNESAGLPVTFSLHSTAHFQASPSQGYISAGQSVDVLLSFKPNQMGTFKPSVPLEVLGGIVEQFSFDGDPTALRLVPIYTAPVHLHGTGTRETNKSKLQPPPGVPQVAHPNDRATSIRPAKRDENVRTLFTGIERYTFVDPDYAFTDKEEKERVEHKQQYLDYIKGLRENRLASEKRNEFHQYNNDTDLGMKSSGGLRPPKLSSKEARSPEKAPSPVDDEVKLLSSLTLAGNKSQTLSKPLSDGLNAVPMTNQEKRDCSSVLSPQQLKLVDIGPSLMDFGQVCLRSVSSKDLTIVNNLDIFIHVVVEIDCRELRQTSPLSQVIPPNSVAKLAMMFESNVRGTFERSINYSINGYHRQHIVVMAEVVSVALELSSVEVELKPSAGLLADSGLRGSITLLNKRNYAAEFSWSPVLDERGTAFSIRPSIGTVDAFTALECEVVYQPAFSAPQETDFLIHVTGGSDLKLKCVAKLGPAHCAFVERRLLFGSVPLHLATSRTVSLRNTSQNHAYFEVIDTRPIPGLVISPKEGVVPVGGTAELKVEFTPTSIHKFDTHIQVNVRGWKTISLRVGGTIEPPCVDIDMNSFQFGGVHCGALATIKFKLSNMTRTEADMVFDLSRYLDFSLKFLDTDLEDEPVDDGNGVYQVSLKSQQVMECALEFQPSEVASYDFIIPVSINHTVAPSPAPSTFPPTPAPSHMNWTISDLMTPVPSVVGVATPSRRVVATALRPPLQLSHSVLEFRLPSGYFELGIESGAGRAQGCLFVNNSDQTLSWTLHTKAAGPYLDDGTFRFLHRTGSPFTPSSAGKKSVIPDITLDSGETFQLGVLFTPQHPGMFVAHIPVILNGNRDCTYRTLTLKGELLAPNLKFDPECLRLTPVPLGTPVSVNFNIIARGYRRASVLDFEIPEVELEDGSLQSVLKVSLPNGQSIQPCCTDDDKGEPFVIPCTVTFQSSSPVSFTASIIFTDGKEKYELPVTATADNCLFSCYPFLAAHQSDFHIVCEQKGISIIDKQLETEDFPPGEAVFMPCVTPNRAPTVASTSATSTSFGISTSTYPESSNEATSSTYPSTPHHGDSQQGGPGRLVSGGSDGNGTFVMVPGMESDERKFIRKAVTAMQRYISSQGWAGGPYPISIPKSLRSALQDTSDPQAGGTGAARTSNWDNNSKKEARSVFDLVGHLCGRPVPGIPLASTLPLCPIDRVRQIHWMYCTLLTFLRSQGAMLSHVKPEDLLDASDYRRWKKLQRNLQGSDGEDLHLDSSSSELEEVEFEARSAQAWTHILSQLVKVLILSRITPHQFKKLPIPNKNSPLPDINPDPLTSNVYSVGERIMLAWINHHYNVQRKINWPGAIGGSSPPCRWIVNFDFDFMDGLVLAALVSAHVPFAISTHLHSMYTRPSKAEQCLHNVLKVVEALRHIGVDYDIQPTDLTEPNPITLLLLCIHLYQRLPHYLPRATVKFEGPLHGTVTKHVRLQNPSTKPLVYQVLLAGKDAVDFHLPMGDTIQVPSKGNLQMPVEFKSRFLRPCNGTLVLVGKREGTPCGNTLVFSLETCITNIVPVATIKSESPCYELQKVSFDVSNPFPLTGEFRIVLVEARNAFPGPSPPKAKTSRSNKNLKAVESRTDHGQLKRSPRREFPPKVEKQRTESDEAPPAPLLSAFWSPSKTIHLEANSTGTVEIHFLPFDVGHRQCSILFINDQIGEFLYCIEANATLPLPSPMPVADSPHSVRISSAAAARTGRGLFGGDERVVYWKCEHDESFTEDLYIPVVNEARENALAIAAQQRMSERELQRRKLTGTLASCTVTASVAALGLGGDRFVHAADSSTRESLEKEVTEFYTELSSKFFQAPTQIIIPTSANRKNAELTSTALKSLKNSIPLSVTFQPKGPGHYPCQIILKSAHDLRVYQVECTVTPEGSALELEFVSPTHQSVTQDIPVVNQSNQDWHLAATIEGEGFYGPPVMVAKSHLSTHYPLMFRPSYEGNVEGRLVLTNTVDGTEQVYKLLGTGQKPLPRDHILIECPARESATYTLQVPNVTRNKLVFQVKTDLDIVSGPASVTILPGKTAEHVITVSPWKRGAFTGIVSFESSGDSPGAGRVQVDEEDEDGQNVPFKAQELASDPRQRPYRLWYTIEVQASAPPPERTLEVTCAAHSVVAVDMAVTNPTRERIVMDVLIEGVALSGEPTVILHPRQQVTYHVTFSPTIIGEHTGSVVFQNEAVGEFWYDLILKATTPLPVTLPSIHCEIGNSTYQMIRLRNPTDESLVLTPHCSNTNNFSLELDNSKQILLAAGSVLEVPLKFTPSAIGNLQSAEVSFHCPQLGNWVFYAHGTGMMPGPMDPINIYSELGGNSSVIIPFRNPTERQVVVDVIMKERLLSRSGGLFNMRLDSQPKASVFCLLLKRAKSIPLEPGATLDIPISFAPDTMQMYEATVTVTIHKEEPEDSWKGDYPSMMSTRMVNDLHWIFPVRGIPESYPIKASQAPCVECKARSRVEERVEVTLTGLAPNAVGSGLGRYPSITPINLLGRHVPGEMEYGVDYLNVPEEFRYELIFDDAESQSCLERSLGVSLLRKMKNQVSGVVILLFNFVFSPFKPFSHKTQLMITAASGGVWRFPIRVLATEPEVDDVITIESVGLNKESVVGFRMNSQMRHTLPFEAFFAPSSDPDFTVTPAYGELPPSGTEGTLIKVAYKPQIYGKTHNAKLVVQTSDMQWTYDILGTTADYNPPNARARITSTSANSARRTVKQRKNYVLENLKLQSTAVSSPYKGVRLVSRSAR